MKDEQMQPLLEAWLREREIPRPPVQAGVARVLAALPRTGQQRRWWPVPTPRRRTTLPAASDTAQYRPDPIPAGNGRGATLTGRTQTMFSPMKAIIAGAIVFALGGAFLIAQPGGRQSEGPPAAEPTGLVEPVAFTAVFGSGSGQGLPATCELVDGVNRCLDARPSSVITEASDPRLSGALTVSISYDEYADRDQPRAFVTFTYRIYNGDGTWQGSGVTTRVRADEELPSLTVLLEGERAYEGLYAWMDVTGTEVSGFIFPGPPPEPTDLAPAG